MIIKAILRGERNPYKLAAQRDLRVKASEEQKFARYLISHGYPIAIDGTQKLQRDQLWAEQCLERQVQTRAGDGTVGTRAQYYVYVLGSQAGFCQRHDHPFVQRVPGP